MHIIFSHGKESGPWGSKITALSDLAKDHGHTTESIDYSGIFDPEVRVSMLSQRLEEIDQPVLLVGSSMGGYTSICNADHPLVERLFLLAPALYLNSSEYKKQKHSVAKPVTIVHGWSDDIVPFELSVRYAHEAKSTLHLIDGDHRLNSSLETVLNLFAVFLNETSSK